LLIPQAREVDCCGVEYSHPQHVTCYSCPSHHFICASGCLCLGHIAVARDGSLLHHLLASSSRILKQIRRFVWKALTVASETSDACSPSQKDVLAAELLSDWLVASCQSRVGLPRRHRFTVYLAKMRMSPHLCQIHLKTCESHVGDREWWSI
jgi:hypothetical protein